MVTLNHVDLNHGGVPRLPRVRVGWAGRAARALTTVLSASVLAVGALTVVPAPARADDAITTQEYFSYYHLDQARAKGYTGKGVTIALIDGTVDTSAPELKGANIVNKSTCTPDSSPGAKQHATLMASLLVAPNYGVAPDATLFTYYASESSDPSSGTCTVGGEELDSVANHINQAIDDGAQIISYSRSSSDHRDSVKWAIARAMNQGVIVVAAIGNNKTDENDTGLQWWSGVVGVSAITSDGAFADYSSWGNGVTTAALGGPVTTRGYKTEGHVETTGTSVATPIAAGMLALARQKWPDATANQILQVLTHTGLNPNHEWNKYTGYGAISISDLVNTDPSQYPNENPLAQKQGGSAPTAQEVKDYGDGLVDPTELPTDASYAYRGTDEFLLRDPDTKATIHLGTSPRYHRK